VLVDESSIPEIAMQDEKEDDFFSLSDDKHPDIKEVRIGFGLSVSVAIRLMVALALKQNDRISLNTVFKNASIDDETIVQHIKNMNVSVEKIGKRY
jgi:hypothetical protein